LIIFVCSFVEKFPSCLFRPALLGELGCHNLLFASHGLSLLSHYKARAAVGENGKSQQMPAPARPRPFALLTRGDSFRLRAGA
jgi:hypothetical protein